MFILACVLGFLAFFVCVLAFAIGFNFGYSAKRDMPIKAPTIPKKAEPDEKLEEWEEGFRNIMKFDGLGKDG